MTDLKPTLTLILRDFFISRIPRAIVLRDHYGWCGIALSFPQCALHDAIQISYVGIPFSKHRGSNMEANDDLCVNCGATFATKSKGYKRQGLCHTDSKPVDVLSANLGVQLDLTPKRSAFFCEDCVRTMIKLASLQKKAEEAKGHLRDASHSTSYLKRKLDFSRTPRKTKVRKLVSTPSKMVTIVMENPRVTSVHI